MEKIPSKGHMDLSDRILVMYEGNIVGEFASKNVTKKETLAEFLQNQSDKDLMLQKMQNFEYADWYLSTFVDKIMAKYPEDEFKYEIYLKYISKDDIVYQNYNFASTKNSTSATFARLDYIDINVEKSGYNIMSASLVGVTNTGVYLYTCAILSNSLVRVYIHSFGAYTDKPNGAVMVGYKKN